MKKKLYSGLISECVKKLAETKNQTQILTWNISPIMKSIHTHDTISPWFVIMNSWLKIGAFLPDFRLVGILLRERDETWTGWKKDQTVGPGLLGRLTAAKSYTKRRGEGYDEEERRGEERGSPVHLRRRRKFLMDSHAVLTANTSDKEWTTQFIYSRLSDFQYLRIDG